MEEKLSKRKKIGVLLCTLPMGIKVMLTALLTISGLPPSQPTELKISALFLIPMFLGAFMLLTAQAPKKQSKTNTFIFSVLGAMLAGFIGWVFWYF